MSEQPSSPLLIFHVNKELNLGIRFILASGLLICAFNVPKALSIIENVFSLRQSSEFRGTRTSLKNVAMNCTPSSQLKSWQKSSNAP
jgi:hypothetical protein